MSWTFELVSGPYGGTTEGPVWDGENILFSYIPGSVILNTILKQGRLQIFSAEHYTRTDFVSTLKETCTAVFRVAAVSVDSRKMVQP